MLFEGWVIDSKAGVQEATFSLDGAAPQTLELNAAGQFSFNASFATDGTDDGVHVLEINAIDRLGNRSPAKRIHFRLDTLVPTILLASPVSGAVISSGAILAGTVSGTGSNLVSLSYQIDDGAVQNIRLGQKASFFASLDLSRTTVGVHQLKVSATDAAGWSVEVSRSFELGALVPFALVRHEPVRGAVDVGSNFRPSIVFTRSVLASSLDENSFYATDTTGVKLPGTIVTSQDGTQAWLFLRDPMPTASTITIVIDGERIQGLDGNSLDADNDGIAGGDILSSLVLSV